MKRGSIRDIPRPLIPLAIFDLTLKGIAAWKAARNRQFGWVVALIVLNTAGVLPLVYLTRFQKHADTPG
jgi:hypothetical protein